MSSEIAGFQIKISRGRNQNFIVLYWCQQRVMLNVFTCLNWTGALSALFVWALDRVSLWCRCLEEPSSCSHLSFPGTILCCVLVLARLLAYFSIYLFICINLAFMASTLIKFLTGYRIFSCYLICVSKFFLELDRNTVIYLLMRKMQSQVPSDLTNI